MESDQGFEPARLAPDHPFPGPPPPAGSPRVPVATAQPSPAQAIAELRNDVDGMRRELLAALSSWTPPAPSRDAAVEAVEAGFASLRSDLQGTLEELRTDLLQSSSGGLADEQTRRLQAAVHSLRETVLDRLETQHTVLRTRLAELAAHSQSSIAASHTTQERLAALVDVMTPFPASGPESDEADLAGPMPFAPTEAALATAVPIDLDEPTEPTWAEVPDTPPITSHEPAAGSEPPELPVEARPLPEQAWAAAGPAPALDEPLAALLEEPADEDEPELTPVYPPDEHAAFAPAEDDAEQPGEEPTLARPVSFLQEPLPARPPLPQRTGGLRAQPPEVPRVPQPSPREVLPARRGLLGRRRPRT